MESRFWQVTRDAASYVSRSLPNVPTVSPCTRRDATWSCFPSGFIPAVSRGLTLRVSFTSSCGRQPSPSPYCFPVLAAAGVHRSRSSAAALCCNIRVYRMIIVVASSAQGPKKKNLAGCQLPHQFSLSPKGPGMNKDTLRGSYNA